MTRSGTSMSVPQTSWGTMMMMDSDVSHAYAVTTRTSMLTDGEQYALSLWGRGRTTASATGVTGANRGPRRRELLWRGHSQPVNGDDDAKGAERKEGPHGCGALGCDVEGVAKNQKVSAPGSPGGCRPDAELGTDFFAEPDTRASLNKTRAAPVRPKLWKCCDENQIPHHSVLPPGRESSTQRWLCCCGSFFPAGAAACGDLNLQSPGSPGTGATSSRQS